MILCKTQTEAERALGLTQEFLLEMQLQTSPEKTKICPFKDGFNFLGFSISSYGITVPDKSKEKFKSAIKEISTKSHNLDSEVANRLNQVIRGTVKYFCTNFSTVEKQFRVLDGWIRKRVRCMKYKRIWITDNPRLGNKHINKMRILSCFDLCKARQRC